MVRSSVFSFIINKISIENKQKNNGKIIHASANQQKERRKKRSRLCETERETDINYYYYFMYMQSQNRILLGRPFTRLIPCIKYHQCDFIVSYLLLDVPIYHTIAYIKFNQSLFPTLLFSIYFSFLLGNVCLSFFIHPTSEPIQMWRSQSCSCVYVIDLSIILT